MKMKLFKMIHVNFVAVTACLFLVSPCKVLAHDEDNDVLGTSDHPLILRPSGGYIAAYERFSFSSYRVPFYTRAAHIDIAKDSLIKTRDITGTLTRIFYRYDHAKNKDALIKAFNSILKEQGFSFAENSRTDSKIGNGLREPNPSVTGRRFKNHLANNPWHSEIFTKAFNTQALSNADRVLKSDDKVGDILVASKLVNAKVVYAILALRELGDSTHSSVGVLLDVIETDSSAPVLTMNAVSISRSIDKTGKADIEGIGFQANQSFMTQDSKFALDEIAQFLKQQSPAKFDLAITDSTIQSATERAKQVREALVLGWGIARKQIRVKGLANAGDAGYIALFERQTD